MAKMANFLVVAFPLHSHVNPTLEFARRLVRAGALATFATTVSAHRRMVESRALEGLSFASFSDGFDDGFKFPFNSKAQKMTVDGNQDLLNFIAQYRRAGAQMIRDVVRTHADQGCPITCIVYSINQTWVADVARELQIPAVVLWIQPSTVMVLYYHYFHGYDEIIKGGSNDPSFVIELPRLPPLTVSDLPSFLLPSDPNSAILSGFRSQFETFDKEVKGRRTQVLVNTFEALEPEALRAIDEFHVSGIGPLIPSSLLDGKGSDSDTLMKKKAEYLEWLDSKPVSSVVYISFGSIISTLKRESEEILNGLVASGRPFLWVLRESESNSDRTMGATGEGMVVPWCSQVEVLSHPSTGCFVTHCGWNSTTESLASGVPMVCFPQWTDQTTNAKLVEDVWKTGVRVKVKEDGVLEGGELKRCLDEVMGGEKGEEIRKNAVKWRDLAREAVAEGGLSDRNIRAFVEEMSRAVPLRNSEAD